MWFNVVLDGQSTQYTYAGLITVHRQSRHTSIYGCVQGHKHLSHIK